MSLGLAEDKSTLVKVMAWCRQTASHNLSQCWPRSVSPYGFIRPQWLGAICSQVIWTNVKHDPRSHKVSLDLSDLTNELCFSDERAHYPHSTVLCQTIALLNWVSKLMHFCISLNTRWHYFCFHNLLSWTSTWGNNVFIYLHRINFDIISKYLLWNSLKNGFLLNCHTWSCIMFRLLTHPQNMSDGLLAITSIP